MESLALALVVGATFSWALAQVIGKVALRNLSSLVFNTVRFSVATSMIVVGGFLFGSWESIEIGAPFFAAVGSGIFAWFVAIYVYFYVLKRDAAHRIIPAGNAYPFWAILLSVLILGENITPVIPVSATLVFLGTYLLSRRQEGEDRGWKFGVPLASIVAFLWGANAILNKFALDGGMTPSAILLVRSISAVILFWLGFIIINFKKNLVFHKKSIGLSALSGMIGLPIGSLLYVSALSMEKASTLAPVTGGTVLFGFIFSVILLDESPTKEAVIGMLAIFSGIVLMTF